MSHNKRQEESEVNVSSDNCLFTTECCDKTGKQNVCLGVQVQTHL